jgi:hypothetical protein
VRGRGEPGRVACSDRAHESPQRLTFHVRLVLPGVAFPSDVAVDVMRWAWRWRVGPRRGTTGEDFVFWRGQLEAATPVPRSTSGVGWLLNAVTSQRRRRYALRDSPSLPPQPRTSSPTGGGAQTEVLGGAPQF